MISNYGTDAKMPMNSGIKALHYRIQPTSPSFQLLYAFGGINSKQNSNEVEFSNLLVGARTSLGSHSISPLAAEMLSP